MDYFETLYKNFNCNLVVVAYRGYSGSEGTPNEAGIILDGEAMVDFCEKEPKINNNRVFLMGRSLGGALAVHLSAQMCEKKDPYFKGVVIESTFTSISDMAD
jgi:fermentation-respiration switch protein FrsA (DUF1100 family)